jgi:hypothetical protein
VCKGVGARYRHFKHGVSGMPPISTYTTAKYISKPLSKKSYKIK